MADSHAREVNRRLFPSFLAASPLAAYGASSGFAQGVSAPAKLPDPIAWGPLELNRLIKSPKEAINVFDFEPVMRQNVPTAHFMRSGLTQLANVIGPGRRFGTRTTCKPDTSFSRSLKTCGRSPF